SAMGELSAIWDSVERLGSLSLWSQGILAVLILLSFFFTAVALIATWRKEGLQGIDALRQAQLIADTNERASNADEKAARATERTAKLEATAEQLRLEAEEARLARAEIEERL